MKNDIGLIAAIISIVAVVVFGFKLVRSSSPQNVATWVMWFLLNLIITASMIAAGNKEAWLPAGFTVGALFVSLILIHKGGWELGFIEVTCAIGCTVAMILWYFSGPEGAVIVSCIAMWISSVPLLRDTFQKPDPTFWWMWAIGATCGVISIIIADAWTIEERLFACSSSIFNAMMTYLTLRKSSPSLTETC